MADPTKLTLDAAVEIDGREDTTQLAVQAHTTQTEPLQTWADHSGDAVAKMSGDGRLQVGDFAIDPPPPSALVEANADITLPSGRPKRAWQALGKLTGALSEAVAWAAHELRLLGSGEVTGLHAALRGAIRYDKSGVDSDEAELRAGDFLAANDAGALGRTVGVKAAVANASGATITTAVAVQAGLENAGTVAKFFALDAGGPIQIEEQAEVTEAEASGKGVIYALDDGTLHYKRYNGVDHDLTGGGETVVVRNASGAAAEVGDVGYLAGDGAYHTTTTAKQIVDWCVVVTGGASDAPVRVARRGTVQVRYTDTAPTQGQFLTTSGVAGRAQGESLLQPAIFAVCLEDGADGLVPVLLLTGRAFHAVNSTMYPYISEGATRSDFVSTITALAGPSVTYGAVSAGDENALRYDNTRSHASALVLHNTTRGDAARIQDVNVSTNTITLTADAPVTWQTSDTVTIRSQTCAKNFGTAYYVDLFVGDHADAPAYPVGLQGYCWIWASGAASAFHWHPCAAWNVAMDQVIDAPAGGWTGAVLGPCPLIDRRLSVLYEPATSVEVQIQLNGFVAATA